MWRSPRASQKNCTHANTRCAHRESVHTLLTSLQVTSARLSDLMFWGEINEEKQSGGQTLSNDVIARTWLVDTTRTTNGSQMNYKWKPGAAKILSLALQILHPVVRFPCCLIVR